MTNGALRAGRRSARRRRRPECRSARASPRSTRSPRSASPGVGDNDPPPDGSGTMTSLELVKKLVAHGADVNARMTQKANLDEHAPERARRDAVPAGGPDGRRRADEDARRARRRPAAAQRRQQHAADGRGRPRDALARRGRRHRGRGARGRPGRARARRRRQRRRQQRRDRDARRGLQEPSRAS